MVSLLTSQAILCELHFLEICVCVCVCVCVCIDENKKSSLKEKPNINKETQRFTRSAWHLGSRVNSTIHDTPPKKINRRVLQRAGVRAMLGTVWPTALTIGVRPPFTCGLCNGGALSPPPPHTHTHPSFPPFLPLSPSLPPSLSLLRPTRVFRSETLFLSCILRQPRTRPPPFAWLSCICTSCVTIDD